MKVFSLALLASFTAVQASEEAILGYTPLTSVTDHAALDLDQEAMEGELSKEDAAGFASAQAIYEKGAFSKSFARLTLEAGLSSTVQSGVQVTGVNADGNPVAGKVYAEASAGDKSLDVQYATTNIQSSYSTCQVGANPNPVLDGCFAANGTITIQGVGDAKYAYTQTTDNLNGRTLQGFSTAAQKKMLQCGLGCPMAEFEKFSNYYGRPDYADHYIESAFAGSTTSFTNGNAQMGVYGYEGRAQCVKKGSSYMSVWMYIVREMLDAINDCNSNCATGACNDDHVNAWDEAVAFYVGSQAKINGGEGGYFPFTLAEKRCANFGTCDGASGLSVVNDVIFDEFDKGKQLLLEKECDATMTPTKNIIAQMTVPLIQGVYRYAYRLGVSDDYSEAADAELAVFAAAVIPRLHACSPSAASTVYTNTKIGRTSVNFQAIKSAFEGQYECLRINCADVGCVLDANGECQADAPACEGGYVRSDSGASSLGFVGSMAAAAALTLFALF